MLTTKTILNKTKHFTLLLSLLMVIVFSKSMKATDYYWVGGTSIDFMDLGNWRLGSPTGSTPSSFLSSASTNVFFGVYSDFTTYGTSVRLSQNVTIGSLSVSGCTIEPMFTQTAAWKLTVANGFTLEPGVGVNLTAIEFASNSPQSIITASVVLNVQNIYITGNGNYTFDVLTTNTAAALGFVYHSGIGNFTCNNNSIFLYYQKLSAGNVTFMGSLDIYNGMDLQGGGIYSFNGPVTGNGIIFFTNGIFNTNNYPFTSGQFLDNGSSLPHTLNAGTTQFNLTYATNSGATYYTSWQYSGSGAVLNLLPGSKINILFCNSQGSSLIGANGQVYYDIIGASACTNLYITGNGMSINNVIANGKGGVSGNNNYINNAIFSDAGILNGNNTFTTTIFNGDGSFIGNSTFGSLTLNGYNYSFTSGSTQSVTAAFTATVPSCTGLKEINATSTGKAFINISTTATAVSNNSKINGLGIIGNPLISAGSLDLGNNSNIVFPAPIAKTLYWVGGSGNWNDLYHWSTVSGAAYPSTTGCIPTLLDNIVFDTGSGAISTITVTGAQPYCNNMSWLGAIGSPTVNMPYTYTLSIYGSVILQPSLTLQTVYIDMMSPTSASITCNGARLGDGGAGNGSEVHFNTAGPWECMDDFYVQVITESNLSTINSNNHYMNIYRMGSNGILNIGTSLIDVTMNPWWPGNIGYPWVTYGMVKTLPGSHIQMWYGTDEYGFYTGNNQNYWDVTFLNAVKPIMSSGTNNTYHNVIFNRGARIWGSPAIFNKLQIGTLSGGGGNSTINTSNKADTLICYGGYTYDFVDATTQTVTSMLSFSNSPCSGLMTAISSGTANFNVTGTTYLNISDANVANLNIIGGAITAVSSYDDGGNTNISFTPITPKTLYWIGGTGNWNDKRHWTTSPFMVGGDTLYPSINGCVPSKYDDVIFLYTITGFTAGVNSVGLGVGGPAICHNISWLNAIGNPQFLLDSYLSEINIYGSIVGQSAMTWKVRLNMVTAATQTATIKSNGIFFNNPYTESNMIGSGTRILLDDFNAGPSSYSVFNITDGVFVTNNYKVNFSTLKAFGTATLSLGTSSITAWGWFTNASGVIVNTSIGSFLTIDGTPSSYAWTNYDLMSTKNTDVYYDVYFSTTATAYLYGGGAKFHNTFFNNNGIITGNNVFNKLAFIGNGTINNDNTTDTLILSAGKTYALQNLGIQTVNKRLYASGNNCAKIVLNSTLAGSQAKLKVNAGSVLNDFDEVKDIDATPSYTPLLFAGNSTDFGNNTNIVFSGSVSAVTNGLASNYSSVPITSMTVCSNKLPIILNCRDYFPNPLTTFNWSDGSHADSLVVNSAGVYSVNIIYSALGVPCSLIPRITIVVNTASVTAPSKAICVGSTATLTAAGATTYTWSSGPTTATYPVSTAGIYTVTGTDGNGCIGIATASLTIHATPTLAIAISNAAICTGASATLIPSGASTYTLLNTGDAIVTNTVVSPSSTTIYTVSSTSADGCLSAEETVTLTINALPSLTLSTSSNPICPNTTVTLTATGADNYSWTAGPSTDTYTVNPSTTTAYDVTGTNTLTGCVSVLETITQMVNPTPTIIANALAATVCSNGMINLSVSGASTYTWSGTGITTTSQNSINPSFSSPAENTYTYTVIGTSMANCKSDTALVIVSVVGAPSSSLAIASQTVCEGTATSFSVANPQGGIVYTWNGTTTGTGYSVPTTIINTAGTYTLGITAVLGAGTATCGTSNTATILVNPTPSIAVTQSTVIVCNNEDAIFAINNPLSSPASYVWSFDNSTNTSLLISSTETNQTGVYTIMVIDANGCKNSTTITLTVNDCDVIIPELFSPNGDGKNDTWFIKGIEHYPNNSVQIFNRWGNIIYQKDGYQNDWKGTNDKGNGKVLPAGTYYVIFNYGDGKTKTYNGFVQVEY